MSHDEAPSAAAGTTSTRPKLRIAKRRSKAATIDAAPYPDPDPRPPD
jgi:hypothetical protein